MSLLREILEEGPFKPDGWNVGHLANLGIMLSCDGYSLRLDLDNLNRLFDCAEFSEEGTVTDHSGKTVQVIPDGSTIVLVPQENIDFPFGLVLDKETLKEMGIEAYEENDPESEYDELSDDDTITNNEYKFDELSDEDSLEEGVKRAYRRSGNKIKRGFRVTSGFRKGRIVSSAKGASKPRKKASTRMKLRIASKRKKVIRILKGKRTRRKSASRRLVQMNKRLK